MRMGSSDPGTEFDTSFESGPTVSANIRTNTPRNGSTARSRTTGARNTGYVQFRRRSLFTWFVGGFLAMVWIFLLGVMVGRGTITSTEAYKEVEQILAMDRASDSGPAVEVIGEDKEDASPPEIPDTHLTFYDSLTQTKPLPHRGLPEPDIAPVESASLPNKPEPQPKQAPQPKAAPQSKPAPQPKPAARNNPAAETDPERESTRPQQTARQNVKPRAAIKTRVQSNLEFERDEILPSLATANMVSVGTRQSRLSRREAASDVLTVEDDRSLAPPPTRQSGENFTIQVSAAGTIEDANREVRKLRNKGYDAYTYQVELNGRKYFRIRVGRYETREDAEPIVNRLARTGKKGMFISALTD